ncbi:MAG: hypothetical protein OXE43_01250 [Chloroflexi bacterium]|nr:hypothetical protein [Chloroflexota bacterium]
MADVRKYHEDLDKLIALGNDVGKSLDAIRTSLTGIPDTTRSYQKWYTESSRFIGQVLPERSEEFKEMYSGGSGGTIPYYLSCIEEGESLSKIYSQSVSNRFRTQLHILESAKSVFTSSLFDIRALAQANLFDSELDAANELCRNGFLRAAGVVAAVVLERHLGQVTENHNLPVSKQSPTLGDFNELLKKEGVVDVPAWRQIQRLGDLRNLCAHNKEREPTKEEVDELIEGADKYTKTLF